MNEWALPSWLTLGWSADVVTWLGFLLTCWIGWQAKSIKDYFFNRVRIGEILPELTTESTLLLKALESWESTNGNGRQAHIVIASLRGRLINLKGKVGPDEKKSLSRLLAKIEKKKFYLIPGKVSDIGIDEAWDIATDYAGIISQVTGGHNDLGWRQK
jgi:hypothetical protein